MGTGVGWMVMDLAEHALFAVLVRCRERPRGVLQQLSAEGVPFVVYQKGGSCAGNRSGALCGECAPTTAGFPCCWRLVAEQPEPGVAHDGGGLVAA